MASSLPGTVNVSRFFNRKDFSNTVEIIVNDTKFICSGVLLAHLSPVFEKIFSTGASFVLLQDFFFSGAEILVEECLTLLYGGKVLVTDRNIATLTRFSLIYDVKTMYDMALDWIKENISHSNVFDMFKIGNLPEVQSRKTDIQSLCLEFMKKHDTDVSTEMLNQLKAEKSISWDFMRAMIKLTNCSAFVSFLVAYCGLSENNTYFVLDLSENINFEKLFLEQKELFNLLMGSMMRHTEVPSRLKQLLEIQMTVLKM